MLPFPDKKYQILYSDPPWQYRDRIRSEGGKQHVSCHYPEMTFGDLVRLPVIDLRDPRGCLHYMWATGPNLDLAIALLEEWGFKYRQVYKVWEKQRVVRGFYSMTSCEFLLVGVYKKSPGKKIRPESYQEDAVRAVTADLTNEELKKLDDMRRYDETRHDTCRRLIGEYCATVDMARAMLWPALYPEYASITPPPMPVNNKKVQKSLEKETKRDEKGSIRPRRR